MNIRNVVIPTLVSFIVSIAFGFTSGTAIADPGGSAGPPRIIDFEVFDDQDESFFGKVFLKAGPPANPIGLTGYPALDFTVVRFGCDVGCGLNPANDPGRRFCAMYLWTNYADITKTRRLLTFTTPCVGEQYADKVILPDFTDAELLSGDICIEVWRETDDGLDGPDNSLDILSLRAQQGSLSCDDLKALSP